MGVLIEATITEHHVRCPVNSINLFLMVLESASPRLGRWPWVLASIQTCGSRALSLLPVMASLISFLRAPPLTSNCFLLKIITLRGQSFNKFLGIVHNSEKPKYSWHHRKIIQNFLKPQENRSGGFPVTWGLGNKMSI